MLKIIDRFLAYIYDAESVFKINIKNKTKYYRKLAIWNILFGGLGGTLAWIFKFIIIRFI